MFVSSYVFNKWVSLKTLDSQEVSLEEGAGHRCACPKLLAVIGPE
jgi:hypothetical protein